MNIKSAISTIMVKFFAFLSGASFLILMCVADVPLGEEWKVLLTLTFTLVTAFIAVLIFDYKIIFRHVFAISSVISLFFGVIFKKNSKKYRYLYKTIIQEDSISNFYFHMLYRYDAWKLGLLSKR